MTNKIIAQSSRFRAVRTSRDRVRIKEATGRSELASFVRTASGEFIIYWYVNTPSQDLKTFILAVSRTLGQEVK